jgi:hypothetical protein
MTVIACPLASVVGRAVQCVRILIAGCLALILEYNVALECESLLDSRAPPFWVAASVGTKLQPQWPSMLMITSCIAFRCCAQCGR